MKNMIWSFIVITVAPSFVVANNAILIGSFQIITFLILLQLSRSSHRSSSTHITWMADRKVPKSFKVGGGSITASSYRPSTRVYVRAQQY
jgi:hypothetical protein